MANLLGKGDDIVTSSVLQYFHFTLKYFNVKIDFRENVNARFLLHFHLHREESVVLLRY